MQGGPGGRYGGSGVRGDGCEGDPRYEADPCARGDGCEDDWVIRRLPSPLPSPCGQGEGKHAGGPGARYGWSGVRGDGCEGDPRYEADPCARGDGCEDDWVIRRLPSPLPSPCGQGEGK